ncbi:hypothetical protein BC938DRAFT_478687 [Jimgerdemannia flammicorona]|uniref:Methyltransferase type 11 domain-containing protein n=1 Tax=Jimgerdemannia flammicorona TaxID=994334 RepID=A0A433QYA1_9FUNG|nr:hypothetical protein BC938DRAFT_478687 [Jimgerdemannia flammicorona]
MCFREKQWPGIIRELVRVMKPGGWIEFVWFLLMEFLCIHPFSVMILKVDGDIRPSDGGPLLTEFWNKVRIMMSMRDINTRQVHNIHNSFRLLGFKQITSDHRCIPIGRGPEDVAVGSIIGHAQTQASLRPQMTLALGLGNDEYDSMVDAAEKGSRDYKPYFNIYYVFGKKLEGCGDDAQNSESGHS